MIFQRLRVFVSSKMRELAPERQALKVALDALRVDAWVFEEDSGAPANIHLLKAAVRLWQSGKIRL
jgi:hypothetical protein